MGVLEILVVLFVAVVIVLATSGKVFDTAARIGGTAFLLWALLQLVRAIL